MPEFSCGHKPWMGVRCDECSPQLTPEQAIGVGRGTYCPSCAAKDARIAELKQQVGNLEEYMLKGVVFRDELQFRLAALEKVAEAAEWFADDHDNAAKRAFEANRSYEATCPCRLCVAIDKLRRLTEGRGEKEGG